MTIANPRPPHLEVTFYISVGDSWQDTNGVNWRVETITGDEITLVREVRERVSSMGLVHRYRQTYKAK